MVAGFVVARFGKVGQGADADRLDQLVFAHPSGDLGLEGRVLVLQHVPRAADQQLAAHPRQHDRRLEWLEDVVGDAGVESALLVFVAVLRGEEDDRDVTHRRVVAQLCEHFMPAHLGHHDVEQDQPGTRQLASKVQGDMAVVCDLDPIPRALQQFAEHAQVFRLIVDDEDGFMVGGAPAFGWGRRFAVRGDGRRHGRGTGRREFGGSEVHGARHRAREGLSVRNSRFLRRRGAGR